MNNISKRELDKLRSSVLYGDEILKVIYNGKYNNFPRGVGIEVYSRSAKHSGLEYPQPKWIATDYYIKDSDGDRYLIASERYGKLPTGFEWVNC